MSIALAAGLAALTLVRFAILVSTLSPNEYGHLSIFLTFVNLAPAVMSLGVSWQYQRISRHAGPGAALRLSEIGHRLLLYTLGPSIAMAALIGAPFVGGESLLLISLYTVVISGSTCLVTLDSQIVLGLGYRSLASFMLFAVNGGVTFGLLPIVISGHATIAMVLGYWAAASVIAWAWSHGALVLLAHGHPRIKVAASIREGLATLPALVGTFLLVFLARYILGLNADGAVVATYSMSSTITESAFLISVSLVGVYSNKIMDGEHPNRSLVLAIPCLLLLTGVGLATVSFLLPHIARSGYMISLPVTLILSVAGLSRLFISAWKSRIVGRKMVHASSWTYIAVAAVMAGVLVLWRSDQVVVYALAQTAAFVVVAVYQWTTVRTGEGSRQGPGGATQVEPSAPATAGS